MEDSGLVQKAKTGGVAGTMERVAVAACRAEGRALARAGRAEGRAAAAAGRAEGKAAAIAGRAEGFRRLKKKPRRQSCHRHRRPPRSTARLLAPGNGVLLAAGSVRPGDDAEILHAVTAVQPALKTVPLMKAILIAVAPAVTMIQAVTEVTVTLPAHAQTATMKRTGHLATAH
ncbi:uncharacterized protein LOC126249114 [Schistocerca nitens]|uniref:uncharacterized protein LOC126249114 n=1 Tax=Schistocerca nitens TaxID=7011 RepID=UPI00211835AE|nr:uncharacterized protein LOC126249114 [Schistocerca nitens]